MILIYLTRNLIDDKIYVGVHKQRKSSLEFDGYSRARKKYGDSNFARETLKVCDNYFEAYRLESLIVDEVFVARKDTYNLKTGGNGGISLSYESRALISKSLKGRIQPPRSEETRRRISEGLLGRVNSKSCRKKISIALQGNNNASGHKINFTLEAKEKISKSLKGCIRSESTREKMRKPKSEFTRQKMKFVRNARNPRNIEFWITRSFLMTNFVP